MCYIKTLGVMFASRACRPPALLTLVRDCTVLIIDRLDYQPRPAEEASAEDIKAAFGHTAYWKYEYMRLLNLVRAGVPAERERRLRILMEEALNNIAVYAAG